MSASVVGGLLSNATIAQAIEAYAQSLQPSVAFIMIGTIFSSMLVPLLIALFYFSTSHTRRQPVFILNVCAVSLALVSGVLNAHLQITTILSPLKGDSPTEDFIGSILLLWMPWISEAVLVLRVLAVFQPCTKRKIIALLAFPVAMKCLRVSIFVVYLHKWRLSFHGPYAPTVILRLTTSWIAKVSYIAELVDNCYMSGTFLLQLNRRGHLFKATIFGDRTTGTIFSLGSRIKSLFWIAATSFVFPVLLNTCSIIITFTSGNIVMASYFAMTNLYVVIICTVLATVWSQSLLYRETQQHSELPVSMLQFGSLSPQGQVRPSTLACIPCSDLRANHLDEVDLSAKVTFHDVLEAYAESRESEKAATSSRRICTSTDA